MPNANEIGKGQAIKFNGDICMVLETQHRTPGNLRAFVQATLRSMRTGKSFVQRFNSNESLEIVPMSPQEVRVQLQGQHRLPFPRSRDLR